MQYPVTLPVFQAMINTLRHIPSQPMGNDHGFQITLSFFIRNVNFGEGFEFLNFYHCEGFAFLNSSQPIP